MSLALYWRHSSAFRQAFYDDDEENISSLSSYGPVTTVHNSVQMLGTLWEVSSNVWLTPVQGDLSLDRVDWLLAV